MRLATAACMQKYGNVSFVTVACAKCMRYGGGWGTMPLGGGVGIRDPDSYIYIFFNRNCIRTYVHGENGGALGMVPLIINPIYTLYSGYLL